MVQSLLLIIILNLPVIIASTTFFETPYLHSSTRDDPANNDVAEFVGLE